MGRMSTPNRALAIATIERGCLNTAVTSDDLRDAISEQLQSLHPGSLTFWGIWFGKPYDNSHRIVGADSSDGTAVIFFDHAETLIVDQPRGWSVGRGRLLIRNATRVRFQWFPYGRLPSRDSLRFEEYRRVAGRVEFTTDFMSDLRKPSLQIAEPAVQLHSLEL